MVFILNLVIKLVNNFILKYLDHNSYISTFFSISFWISPLLSYSYKDSACSIPVDIEELLPYVNKYLLFFGEYVNNISVNKQVCLQYLNSLIARFGIAGLTKLTHLDLFGARITDSGTNSLRCMLKIYFICPCLFSWCYLVIAFKHYLTDIS